jgi:hypothetical protein
VSDVEQYAMRHIEDGQVIMVDGTTGRVFLESETVNHA